MSLDCSHTPIQSVDVSDDKEEDDVIVTLAIPGHKSHESKSVVCCDPVVIASDSEDSDCDVTILSEFSSVPALDSSAAARTNAFGKVLGVPIAGPSEDDCFMSEFHYATKPSVGTGHGLSHSVYVGSKQIFEESSSHSFIGSPDLLVSDPFVQGKDPFLSDALSYCDADSLHTSVDVHDKHSSHLLFGSSSCDMSAMKDVDIDEVKSGCIEEKSRKAASDNVVLLPPVSTCADGNGISTKITVLTSVACENRALKTSLICSKSSAQMKSDVSSVPDASCGSSFCLSASEKLYADSVKGSKSTAYRLPLTKQSTEGQVSVRHRRHSKSKLLSSDSIPSSTSQSVECSAKQWTVQHKGEFKVLLRRSVSQMAPGSIPDSSEHISRKRSRCHLSSYNAHSVFISAANDASATSDIVTHSMPEMSVCYGCRSSVPVYQLSYCMAGHGCCGQCLQSQVKTLLASGKKVIYCHV